MRIVALVLCGLFVTASSPVLADESVATTSSLGPSSTPSAHKRILGAVIGTVIGTPICAVRRIAYNETYGVHGMVGNTDNRVAIVSAGAFWLPFSVVIGAVEAPCYSFKHSVCNTAKPFSKEQFSLGADVD